MKTIIPVLLSALLAGCTPSRKDDHVDHSKTEKGHTHHGSHADHGGKERVGQLMVRTEPSKARSGQPTTLRLMIHEADGTMVKDFEAVHEANVHLIVVRDGLDQFAHIHPEVDDAGNLTATFSFPTGGMYRLYADYKPVGKAQAVATAEVKVSGPSSPAPQLSPDVPGQVKGDGLAAEVAVTSAKAGSPTTISVRLLDPAGQPVSDLQPYLGAKGHLVVLSADGKEYVHAHPVEKVTAGTVGFEAHFAKPGVYKGWGQFRRSGKVHTVPFVMRIE